MIKTEAQYYTERDIVNKLIGSGLHIKEGSPPECAAHPGSGPACARRAGSEREHPSEPGHAKGVAERRQARGVADLRGLDHQLDDSDARIALLTKAGELLDRTIGR